MNVVEARVGEAKGGTIDRVKEVEKGVMDLGGKVENVDVIGWQRQSWGHRLVVGDGVGAARSR
jgi:hypothetical protein